MTDAPSVKEQIEALVDLQAHPGWLAFRAMLVKEVSDDFEEHITKALNVPDGAMAIERMRQVAAMRDVGLKWLKWPHDRVKQLKEQEARAEALASPSRRPLGV